MLINIDELFIKTGFDTGLLEASEIMKLRMLVDREKWVQTIHLKEQHNQTLSMPNWMFKFSKNIDGYSKAKNKDKWLKEEQEAYLSVKDKTFNYFNIFNNIFNKTELSNFYKVDLKRIYLWNGVGPNAWHQDTITNADIFVLVYLSDYEQWPEKYGGVFEGGVKNKEGVIKVVFRGKADNGRFIISNNRNPRLFHRVNDYSKEGFNKKINRFTFLLKFKLSERE